MSKATGNTTTWRRWLLCQRVAATVVRNLGTERNKADDFALFFMDHPDHRRVVLDKKYRARQN